MNNLEEKEHKRESSHEREREYSNTQLRASHILGKYLITEYTPGLLTLYIEIGTPSDSPRYP